MKRNLKWIGLGLLGLAAIASILGHPLTAFLPADVLSALAGAGAMPFVIGDTAEDELAAAVKELPKLAEDLRKKTDEVKGLATEFTGKLQAGEKVSTEAKAKADEALLELNKVRDMVKEIEQKIARQTELQNQGGGERKTLGEQFIEAENVKTFLASPGQRGRVDHEIKATITLATDVNPGAAGALQRPTRLPGVIAPPERRLTIRDLITPGQMDGNALEYVRETGFTNAAANVAEVTRKPESDLRYDNVSTTARVIAHYMKASRQVMSDAPQLRSMIDGRLLYGLGLREEAQILNGDGTGQNLLGILPQATAFAIPAGSGLAFDTEIDQLRVAILQAFLAEFPPTGHVLNPIDWARIEMLKDTQGRYIIGNPQGNIQPTLWGLPVVETQAMAVDTFLTGAFRAGAQLFDRWRARVELATENEDDFVNNRVTILAEERLALAVYRPQAFVLGDFGNVV